MSHWYHWLTLASTVISVANSSFTVVRVTVKAKKVIGDFLKKRKH